MQGSQISEEERIMSQEQKAKIGSWSIFTLQDEKTEKNQNSRPIREPKWTCDKTGKSGDSNKEESVIRK